MTLEEALKVKYRLMQISPATSTHQIWIVTEDGINYRIHIPPAWLSEEQSMFESVFSNRSPQG